MQARIDVGGVLQLEVESTTEYWAVKEWLRQVTLTHEAVNDPFKTGKAQLETEKFQAIDPSFIELNWEKIGRTS
jgi:hypothetical protein